jgi:YidC/Oxa1 family membrane protein insertase
MVFWDQSVEILRESILAYAQLCNGSIGCGILLITFLARLALLPLGIRLGRAAYVQQRAMDRIRPELDALRIKHRSDPASLAAATRRLMVREGVSMIPAAGCIGGLAQVPVVIALYSAVSKVASLGGRFLWIRDIAKPDFVLCAVATALTVAATAAGPSSPAANRMVLLAVSGIVTAVALSKMAAGVGLYWALSSLFGVVQGHVVRQGAERLSV